MSQEDFEYYRDRVLVERNLAAGAPVPKVAFVHTQLADLYEAVIGQEPTISPTASPWPLALKEVRRKV